MNPLPRLSLLGPLALVRALFRAHVFGSLLLIAVTTLIISVQVVDRDSFADSELADAVSERWGAPVVQPAPSLRFVQSGTVFTELRPLAFEKQHVEVTAQMNYRKRGLRYFSGFDFALVASYSAANREAHDIDVAFVFPIEVNKSQVLLSELGFEVNGKKEQLDLGDKGDRLLWTGRIPAGKRADFTIRYKARGLDSLLYKLDPALPARDVHLRVSVNGGENFDYPAGVLSATRVTGAREAVTLDWEYPALESGVSLGLVLPSEQTYDTLIATMARRAWAPGLCFLLLLAALGLRHARPLAVYEAYLLAAAYGFSFVVLAYLAAFMSFYVAYAVTLLGLGAAVTVYASRLFPMEGWKRLALLWVAAQGVPTLAVILQGYTGLIYTLELLAALLGLMALSTRASVRAFLSDLSSSPSLGKSTP